MHPMLASANQSKEGAVQSRSPRWLTMGRLLGCLSILGLMVLSYVAGAAVLYFQLPTSGFLVNAFIGGVAANERGKPFVPSISPGKPWPLGLIVDNPGKTEDGFTLLTTTQFCRALLLDMKGTTVHKWELPFEQVWPHAPHVKNQLAGDQIQWFTAHLFPNGDLLAIYQAENDSPCGYGLVKLDKDSHVVWKYAANAHHSVDVGDEGKIYTIVQHNVMERPRDLDQIPSPYTDDYLTILSPKGEELTSFSITQAYLASPFALQFKNAVLERLEVANRNPFGGGMLTTNGQKPPNQGPAIGPAPDKLKLSMPIDFKWQTGMNIKLRGDLVHGNSAKVLTKELKRAGGFPLFKAGQVMVSLRTLDLIAVIDPETKQVVWSSSGVWCQQHDPEFLSNGHLLVYDNSGSRLGTRIVEIDPMTQAVSWMYSGEDSAPLVAANRGMKERLNNGNTLIVDPEPGRLIEVTPDLKIVWQFNPAPEPGKNTSKDSPLPPHALTSAHRYLAQNLTFMQKIATPRP